MLTQNLTVFFSVYWNVFLGCVQINDFSKIHKLKKIKNLEFIGAKKIEESKEHCLIIDFCIYDYKLSVCIGST